MSSNQEKEFLRGWERSGVVVDGWAFRMSPPKRVSPFFDEDLPLESGDPWEWKVEVDALELAHPEVVVSTDLRVRAGAVRVKRLAFTMTRVGDYDGTELFRRLRLGAMHDGLNHVLRSGRFLYRSDTPSERVDVTEWQLELPRPGRAGHPDRYYADWVKKYLDAIEEHGARRYMPGLLEKNPNYSAKYVRWVIDRAEQLKLITDRPGRGKAGGQMTVECQRLLKED